MISKAPDMKNNMFIVPPLKYIDFDVVFKVLLGKKLEKTEEVEKFENPKNRKQPKLNPMFKITQKSH